MEFFDIRDLENPTPFQKRLVVLFEENRRKASSTVNDEFKKLCDEFHLQFSHTKNRSTIHPEITYTCKSFALSIKFVFTKSVSNTSPLLSQILSTVISEDYRNEMLDLFSQTNSIFNGKISIKEHNITTDNIKTLFKHIVAKESNVETFQILESVQKCNPEITMKVDEKNGFFISFESEEFIFHSIPLFQIETIRTTDFNYTVISNLNTNFNQKVVSFCFYRNTCDSVDISVSFLKDVLDRKSKSEVTPIESLISFLFDKTNEIINTAVQKHFKSATIIQSIDGLKKEIRNLLKDECDEIEKENILKQCLDKLISFPVRPIFDEQTPITSLLNDFIKEKFNEISSSANKWNHFISINNMLIQYLNAEFVIKTIESSSEIVLVLLKLNELTKKKQSNWSVFEHFQKEISNVKFSSDKIEMCKLDETTFSLCENAEKYHVHFPKDVLSCYECYCTCFVSMGFPSLCRHLIYVMKHKEFSGNIFPFIFHPEVQKITQHVDMFIPKKKNIDEILKIDEGKIPQKRKCKDDSDINFENIKISINRTLKNAFSYISTEKLNFIEEFEVIEEESDDNNVDIQQPIVDEAKQMDRENEESSGNSSEENRNNINIDDTSSVKDDESLEEEIKNQFESELKRLNKSISKRKVKLSMIEIAGPDVVFQKIEKIMKEESHRLSEIAFISQTDDCVNIKLMFIVLKFLNEISKRDYINMIPSIELIDIVKKVSFQHNWNLIIQYDQPNNNFLLNLCSTQTKTVFIIHSSSFDTQRTSSVPIHHNDPKLVQRTQVQFFGELLFDTSIEFIQYHQRSNCSQNVHLTTKIIYLLMKGLPSNSMNSREDELKVIERIINDKIPKIDDWKSLIIQVTNMALRHAKMVMLGKK